MKNVHPIIDATEAAVSAVTSTLTQYNDLQTKVADLEDGLKKLSQSEVELLAGQGTEEQKTRDLLKLQAGIKVRKANIGQLILEKQALQEELFSLAVTANNLLGAVEQGLIAHLTERISEFLSAIFEPDVVKQLRTYANYSKPIKELQRDQFVLIQSRPDLFLDAASKIRAVWDKLAAAVKSEEVEPTFIVPPAWLGITDYAPVAPATPSKAVFVVAHS